MNQFRLIQSFAKGKASGNSKQTQRNTVIYTRVSTEEQADTNQSLETQKKYCLQYALKHDLNVLGFFGGLTKVQRRTDTRAPTLLPVSCFAPPTNNVIRFEGM